MSWAATAMTCGSSHASNSLVRILLGTRDKRWRPSAEAPRGSFAPVCSPSYVCEETRKKAEINHYFNVWIAQEGIKRILNFSETLRLLRTKVGDLEEHKGLEFRQSWWRRENRTVMRRSQTERWGFCTECQWAQSTVLIEWETTQTENWCFILRWSQSRDWTHAQTHARRHTQKRKSPK